MSIRTLALGFEERLLILKEKIIGSPIKKFGALFFVLLIIAGLAGLGRLVQNSQDRQDKAEFSAAVVNYRKLQTDRKPNEARVVLEEYLKTKPKNKKNRSQANYYLSNVWVSLNNYPNARKTAEAALKDMDKPSYSIYIFLGDTTKILKDNDAAISYYQKAFDILKPLTEKEPTYIPIADYARRNVKILKDQKNET